ncbi:AAA family ATPase, partial [Azotobacter chroococcum]
LDGLHGAGDAVFVWRQPTCPPMQASSSLISLIFRENFWGLLRDRGLSVRRYFASKTRELKSSQSNIHAIVNGVPEKELFYGAKNIGTAKAGRLIYIPALTTPAEQMKTSGPSPLRDMLNFMLKRVVSGSAAYKELETAFSKLNDEARGDEGFLSKISGPINEAIAHWGIRFDMGVGSVSPDDITKNLVKHGFIDAMLGDTVFSLDRYGHGFQRSFLYELIKLSPTFAESKKSEKKEFDPDFTLILFEEPEAFLHPSQQENMAYHLRRLAAGAGQQVIITTHSPTFVGKASDDLCQIVRVQRGKGVSTVAQITRERLNRVLGEGAGLLVALRAFVEDVNISNEQKKSARELLQSAPDNEEIAAQEERFRYQLWLDSDRSSMFFADRILLVEGATEKALFTYLLARDWHNLTHHRIAIIDVLGKFNFHRYITLLEGFSVPYGLILDDDHNKNHHKAINEMLKSKAGNNRLAEPILLPGCMENFLESNLPGRDDKKPIEILKALEAKQFSDEKLTELRSLFLRSLDLEQASALSSVDI